MQGIIVLNKQKGKSSFGAVAAVRAVSGQKRIGHTGTLDPLAEGVLPILLGRATALSSYITDGDKGYTARVRLGLRTNTEDITGEVISESPVSVSEEELRETCAAFLGKIKQIPPMFSALKIDGQRLYKLAREGVEVEREARSVEIKKIECRDFDGEFFTLDVLCSKGTYIRSLCRDIGDRLGCGAVMCELTRTFAAGFSIEQAVTVEQLKEDGIAKHLLSADSALSDLGFVRLTERQAIRFSNGGEIDISRTPLKDVADGQLLRVKFGEILLGLGRVDLESGQIKIVCVINDKDGSDNL